MSKQNNGLEFDEIKVGDKLRLRSGDSPTVWHMRVTNITDNGIRGWIAYWEDGKWHRGHNTDHLYFAIDRENRVWTRVTHSYAKVNNRKFVRY